MGKISKEKEEYFIKFFDPDERLNKNCPFCGSNKVVFILYGMPAEEAELMKSGEVILGGCIIGEHNLACRDCEHTWASVKDAERLI
jgi:hypothetical protein